MYELPLAARQPLHFAHRFSLRTHVAAASAALKCPVSLALASPACARAARCAPRPAIEDAAELISRLKLHRYATPQDQPRQFSAAVMVRTLQVFHQLAAACGNSPPH